MKKSLIVFSMAAMLLVACATRNDTDQQEATDVISADASAAAQLAATPNTDLYSNGQTRLIKTVNYRFEVASVKQSAEAIELSIKKYPAYIAASDMRLENRLLENKMTIRVRNEFFQELLKDIDQQARYVNYRDVKTEDVAKQFVDLESRLKSKREVEARYIEILRKKAGTIEELLNAEKQIGGLHEEIEATISRINYLKDEVSYSTINLEFYQTISEQVATGNEISLRKQFGEALYSGWSSMVSVAVVLTYLWPWLIVAAIGAFVYRYVKRKRTVVVS